MWLAAVAVGKPADAVPLPVACAEAKNGLRELPPFAFWRLKFRFPMMSCWERLAVWLSDFGELPLNAHIQAVLLAVRSILPVSQLAQLEPINWTTGPVSDCASRSCVEINYTTYSEYWQS